MKSKHIAVIIIILLAIVAASVIIVSMATKKTAGTDLPKTLTYAALGDSVASGAGLVADISTQCDISSQGYPSQLNDLLIKDGSTVTIQNNTCSGATTADVLGTGSKQSGTSGQLATAFAAQSTDLVTLTIGANDINWISIITQCAGSGCGSAQDTQRVDTLLATLKTNLDTILSSIKDKSGTTTTKVLLTGYYSPFDSISCLNVGGRISPASINWLKAQTVKLNTTIQNAASSKTDSLFVPISFTGHGICDSDPWIQSVSDKAPFHPNVGGQKAMADQIFAALKAS